MDKVKALSILKSIKQDMYGQWRILDHYQSCEKEITLANGEQVIMAAEDVVYDFLDYVQKLIENAEV